MGKWKSGKEIKCPCGKIFYISLCRIKYGKKYCSRKCRSDFIGQTNTGRTHFQKGQIPWNKGKKGYMGANRTSFPKMHKPWNDGKPRPEIRNEKHPNWKGGITPLRNRLWSCYKHTLWRQGVFKRDNFTCVLCGKKGYIEADHFPRPFYKIRDEYNIQTYEEALECNELWDLNNGRTLCVECHKNETKKLRKEMVLQMGS